jgi:hypothetical protein
MAAMDRRAWTVVLVAALGAALATWLLVRTEERGDERPASAVDLENSRLRAEVEGLRKRLDDALDAAERNPSFSVPPPAPARSQDPSSPTPPTGTAPSPAPTVDATLPLLGSTRLEALRVGPTPSALLDELAKYADVKEALRRVAEDSTLDEARRAEALAALSSTGSDDAIDLLRRMLASRDESDRRVARRALFSARHPALAPLLREEIKRSPPDGTEGTPDAVSALARLKGKPWSPLQATGEPDTPRAGDLQTAWASKQPEMGLVWLELDFEEAVLPDAVRVHETLGPGTVAQVLAKAPNGTWVTLWEGEAPRAAAPSWFEPDLGRAHSRTRTIRIVLDTDRVPGWNEIDAVELIGDGRRQWARDARASSSYSD